MHKLFTNHADIWEARGALYEPIRTVTGTTDTITGDDLGTHILYDSASPVAVTLPAPDPGVHQSPYFNGGVPKVFNGWYCYVRNEGDGAVTFTLSGADVLVLYEGHARKLVSDGTAFRVF